MTCHLAVAEHHQCRVSQTHAALPSPQGLLGQVVVTAAADAPGATAAALPLMSRGEREQILTVFNSSDADLDLDYSCVHELFQEHARRQPSARCLVCEGKVLTYREVISVSIAAAPCHGPRCVHELFHQ